MAMFSLLTAIYAMVLTTSPARAQDMLSFLNGNSSMPNISLDDTFIGTAPATDGNQTNLNDENAFVSVPLYEDKDNVYFATFREQQIQLSGQITIPQESYVVPRGFGRADIGLGWINGNLLDGHSGLAASIGTSGPVAFNGLPEISATYFAEWRRWNNDAWIFILTYSNNRTVLNNVPLPGVAYVVNGDTYKLILGLPFLFLNWRPGPILINGGLSPFSANADVNLIAGSFQPFTGFSWAPKSYFEYVQSRFQRQLFLRKARMDGGVPNCI